MTTKEQQYNEEIELAASAIGGLGSRQRPQREDRPELAAKLAELMLTAEGLSLTLADVNGEISLVRAQLLPDDERKGLAQLARDIRDDNLPDVDADVPVTACPSWCEVPDHSGEGKNHAGAISAVQVNASHELRCEVIQGGDGELSLDIWGEGSGLASTQASAHAEGILRAVELYKQLRGI